MRVGGGTRLGFRGGRFRVEIDFRNGFRADRSGGDQPNFRVVRLFQLRGGRRRRENDGVEAEFFEERERLVLTFDGAKRVNAAVFRFETASAPETSVRDEAFAGADEVFGRGGERVGERSAPGNEFVGRRFDRRFDAERRVGGVIGGRDASAVRRSVGGESDLPDRVARARSGGEKRVGGRRRERFRREGRENGQRVFVRRFRARRAGRFGRGRRRRDGVADELERNAFVFLRLFSVDRERFFAVNARVVRVVGAPKDRRFGQPQAATQEIRRIEAGAAFREPQAVAVRRNVFDDF